MRTFYFPHAQLTQLQVQVVILANKKEVLYSVPNVEVKLPPIMSSLIGHVVTNLAKIGISAITAERDLIWRAFIETHLVSIRK